MLKVAVIGLGDVSGIHLEAIRNSSEAELVAVCDIDESRKEAAPDVNFYTDYLEMLDKEDLDCVHVCLPTTCTSLLPRRVWKRASTCT